MKVKETRKFRRNALIDMIIEHNWLNEIEGEHYKYIIERCIENEDIRTDEIFWLARKIVAFTSDENLDEYENITSLMQAISQCLISTFDYE